MELSVERVDVWAATIEDKPGGLAQALSALRDAGADLQFVVARRTPEASGKGVVFVAPLQGEQEIRAATQVGFNVTPSLHSVR
ncbi:amino acid-binding protein, partial [Paraburkholderia sp. SIMBA_055]